MKKGSLVGHCMGPAGVTYSCFPPVGVSLPPAMGTLQNLSAPCISVTCSAHLKHKGKSGFRMYCVLVPVTEWSENNWFVTGWPLCFAEVALHHWLCADRFADDNLDILAGYVLGDPRFRSPARLNKAANRLRPVIVWLEPVIGAEPVPIKRLPNTSAGLLAPNMT